jgi:metal-sulfur cluster biosynthetic enzyme
MSDEKKPAAVNPPTGQPIPDDDAPARPAPMHPGQAFDAAPAAAGPASGETPAPSQQELAIRAALETVMDPEINLSVIDLGLIREIQLLPEKTHVKMMLTTPFCPYAPQLMADVKQATMGVVPKECEVEILPDAWSPDLMPDPSLLGYSF